MGYSGNGICNIPETFLATHQTSCFYKTSSLEDISKASGNIGHLLPNFGDTTGALRRSGHFQNNLEAFLATQQTS